MGKVKFNPIPEPKMTEEDVRLLFKCPTCKLGEKFRILAGFAQLDVVCLACFKRTALASVNKPEVQETKGASV